ncbi:MAG: tetratricopeptide repeat protein [Chloroflexota bacterium]|nr:tetratricopeptide repeat protein [Chloroflexota bacterium]MDQ5865792.1 tetratricopeptide repeat protein [Chloroflexota bacterium]
MGGFNPGFVDEVSNNLPVQPTPFIGREKEVEAACALLQREAVRLVTLTGPGGTGKTRMAVHVGGQMLLDFRHGVFFVALASITDPGIVASSIAQTLGIMEAAHRPVIESIKAYLRDRHMLLILDNFEQIVDAAPIVADIMSAAASLKVLVTSREILHLRGEHEFPVPPLTMPDTKHLPPAEDLTRYEAVRLFVDRAAALRHDFQVTDDNAPAVAEICANLDGLPLAIELAAARIKMLSPEAMLSRLQDQGDGHAQTRLKLLVGGHRDLPVRQQTLRNTIGWSYDLLNEGERALFRRLSVFSGGCGFEAIEAVCNADGTLPVDPLEGVASLADKSLLRQRPGPGGEERFHMLETIQEYAREKLEEGGEASALQEWHGAYFLDLAEKAEPQLRGPKQAEWLERLEAEHDNLRAALKWETEQGRPETGMRLGAALVEFWKAHGHLSEGRSWLEAALEISSTPTQARAKALMAAGNLASAQGDYARASAVLLESLELFRQLGDKVRIAATLKNLGNDARLQGNYDAAYTYFQEGLELARELGNRQEMGTMLGDIGIVAQSLGDQEGARAYYEESLQIRRELKDRRGIAMMLVNLGELARGGGDYDTAQELYEEGLAIARELGDKWGVGMVLHNLGHVAYHRQKYGQAFDLFTQSMSIFYEMRNKRDIAYCLAALGGVYAAQRQPERAAILFSAAQALSNTISAHLDPADLIEYQRNLATARSQMSVEGWERAWRQGQRMTLDEAVAYGLEKVGIKSTAPLSPALTAPLQGLPTGTLNTGRLDTERLNTGPLNTGPLNTGPLNTGPLNEHPAGLSDREMDVLRLVATGLTDGQVADKLMISPRTVHRHLSSIYSKLNVTSRTAATRWAVESKLV